MRGIGPARLSVHARTTLTLIGNPVAFAKCVTWAQAKGKKMRHSARFLIVVVCSSLVAFDALVACETDSTAPAAGAPDAMGVDVNSPPSSDAGPSDSGIDSA